MVTCFLTMDMIGCGIDGRGFSPRVKGEGSGNFWQQSHDFTVSPVSPLRNASIRAHLLERGISPMTVMDFQLGYSPADLTSPLIEYLDQVDG